MIWLAVLGSLALLTTLAPPSHASSLYRRVDEDGVTHFTNAPTDPRFKRIGSLSGTAQGWLRLSDAVRSRYSQEIREIAGRHGVDPDLVEAVIRVESAFNPRAVSNKGAQGLMQLMPRTASALGVRNAFDPYQNIDGGVRHLRYLLDRYPGNVSLALAAYNAGEKAVDYYRGVPPYAETTQYVHKILGQSPSAGSGGTGTVIYRYVGTDGTVTLTNVPRARSAASFR
ncbi:MAG TPA: lytic transglycosylase domain-containing protein [Methylomirabilota bacterium]